MGFEAEIKLSLPDAELPSVRRFFEAHSGMPGRVLPLGNIYFDTPERALAQARAALRLRRIPDGWLQTFKASGVVRDGLHSHAEWELAVAGEALELGPLLQACAEQPEAHALLADVADRVKPLFRTDFTRTVWDIEWAAATTSTPGAGPAGAAGGSSPAQAPALIEVAIDIGTASADVDGEVRCAAISEVELELKRGDESALHALAGALRAVAPGLAPENVSKAQRGYQLLHEGRAAPSSALGRGA